MNAWIKKLSQTKPIQSISDIVLYVTSAPNDPALEFDELIKYWKYQDDRDNPELKEFGERYEKELKIERFLDGVKTIGVVLLSILFYWCVYGLILFFA